ncbi:MAG: outer membrane beta-barrel protein, partial [Planctomycetia bacterium]|nr:outer membrane beta-barrel protein [Planctomycetia bacterium]
MKTIFSLNILLLSVFLVISGNVSANDTVAMPEGVPSTEEVAASSLQEAPETVGLFSGTTFSGYVNAGFLANTRGAHWNGNASTGSRSGGGLQGAYISAVKKAETCKAGGDWGFGTDFMFGEDSRICRVYNGFDESWWTGRNGRGNPWYGFAMPQLYTEFAVQHWTVQLGHFYTPLGYEPV